MVVTITKCRVTLTFDNGPEPRLTPAALDYLFATWRTHSCVPRSHSCERQLL